MNCSLGANNAKVIAKAIQSLSKIGSDLFIEVDKNGLQLRSINASNSAVGTFKFNKIFFEIFEIPPTGENYCKLSMKACLAVFKNMKQVEQCHLRIIADKAKFQVRLKCRLETVKNAFISIVDEENISADISLSPNQNIILGSHRIFNEIAGNFNAAEEEITLESKNNSLTVKNYIEGSRVNDKFMRSQLKLKPAEFEIYKISQESTITFCLKEFRAFLLFAETLNENLNLSFNDGGNPLILKINKLNQIECLLVMSTLSPEDVTLYEECLESEVMNTSNIPSSSKRKHNNIQTNSKINKSRRKIADESTLSNDSTIYQFVGSAKNTLHSSQSVNDARNLSNTKDNINETHRISANQSPIYDTLQNISPFELHQESEISVNFIESEEGKNEEFIAHSPEKQNNRRKLRSIFSRCFESTYIPKEPTPDSQVFVPDSDTEI